MMGSTPYGEAARRTCPSSVAFLRGRATHALRTPESVQCDTTVFITSVWSGAREPLKWVPGRCWLGVGRRLVLKVFSQDGFSSVLWSRSSTRTGWFSRSWTSCDLQRQVPAVPLLWRGGAPASVHRQSG